MEQTLFWLAILMLFIAGYYSLVVMPRQRNFKKHQHYVTTLKLGDEVITYGGIIGKVTELDAEVGVAKVEIAPGVEVRIITAAMIQEYDPQEIERNAQIALGIKGDAEDDAAA